MTGQRPNTYFHRGRSQENISFDHASVVEEPKASIN